MPLFVPQAPSVVPPMVTGNYYGLFYATGLGTVANPADGTARYSLFLVPNPAGVTATRIAAVTGLVGSAGSLGRMGIYRDNNGVPGALVLDAGTIDETAVAGQQQITISQFLNPGLFWLVYVPQGGPATHATMNILSPNLGVTATTSSSNVAEGGWQSTGVAGALPDPAPAVTVQRNPFAVYLKV